jgi:hypothetical protein
LRDGHPERLTREEEDALGEALAAEMNGRVTEAQEWLDLLSQYHRARMMTQAKDEMRGGDSDATT